MRYQILLHSACPASASMQAWIPIRFAGLCSGPRSQHSSITFITSSLMTTDCVILEPPCSTRCPIASTSSRLFNTPVFAIYKCIQYHLDRLGMSRHRSLCDLLLAACRLIYSVCPSIPILSQRPFASNSSLYRNSISWILQGRTSAVDY